MEVGEGLGLGLVEGDGVGVGLDQGEVEGLGLVLGAAVVARSTGVGDTVGLGDGDGVLLYVKAGAAGGGEACALRCVTA